MSNGTWKNKKNGRQSGKYKKVCVTDPDATIATNARNRRLEPAYKQHTAVDDKVGVILDVEVTTGQTNEGDLIAPQFDEVGRTTGVCPKGVTADAGYAYAKVYAAFEKRGIVAVIPAKAEPIRSRVPLRRFRYDAKNDILKCPKGRIMRPKRPLKYGRFFYQRHRELASRPAQDHQDQRFVPVGRGGDQAALPRTQEPWRALETRHRVASRICSVRYLLRRPTSH